MLNDENINVHLHDVHYCLEVNSNLLSLSVLEEKHHTFNVKNAILRMLNDDENIVFVIHKQRSVYVLHQFNEINEYDLSLSSIFSIKSKSVNMKVWHQRVDHVHEKDLSQLSLMSSMWNSLMKTSNLRFAKHVFLISNIELITLARSLIDQKSLKSVFIQISSKETTLYLLWKSISMKSSW